MTASTEFPDTLQISRPRPGVAQITMARPSVFNAFDEAMIGELDAAFAQATQDDSVRVIVLAGEGRHFSAGADLKWMQRSSTASQEWNLADARRFAAMLARIQSCPKPTVARIQGAALGGGVGLCCACDMAIAADNAAFSVSEARFGILPAVISPYLVAAVGKRWAQFLALTATRIDATQALAMGMVHELTTPEQLDAAVNARVTELLAAAPGAQREIKQLFAQITPGAMDEATRELTAQTISRVRATSEARAGFAAFFDKRPAPWVTSP
ncbi:MAG: enoyl-CoA hydratase-related protein [Rhodoferax sp.]|nr:enoyl-CoA hydratase-related protein [Rhodoferax sp.]